MYQWLGRPCCVAMPVVTRRDGEQSSAGEEQTSQFTYFKHKEHLKKLVYVISYYTATIPLLIVCLYVIFSENSGELNCSPLIQVLLDVASAILTARSCDQPHKQSSGSCDPPSQSVPDCEQFVAITKEVGPSCGYRKFV